MSQMMSTVSKPKVSCEIKWRRDGEENQIIVLSKEGMALPLILNPTASRIFSLCDGTNTARAIAAVLCAEYKNADFNIVLKDTKKQIEYFFEKGIISEGGEGDAKDKN